MSSHTSSSYTSYSSTSYTSNGQGTTKSYTEKMTNDHKGTTYERTTSETGKPTYIETKQVPAADQIKDNPEQGRIEDVSDADREYLERMEDEYAKREGGA